jgi:hypothetical protein
LFSPPLRINAATPDGAPPRRFKTGEIIICRFSWFGCEPDRFKLVSPEQKMKKGYLRFPAAMRNNPPSAAKTATPGDNGDLVATGADVAGVLVTSKSGALVTAAA